MTNPKTDAREWLYFIAAVTQNVDSIERATLTHFAHIMILGDASAQGQSMMRKKGAWMLTRQAKCERVKG